MLNSPWPQFLRSLAIYGLRGWNGEEIRFEFPVVAIAGENGSGKSTILEAAASAYSNPRDKKLSFYPSDFFPDTAWETISGVSLNYKIYQGDHEKVYAIRKPTQRWRGLPKRPRRNIIFQDISRIKPLNATVGYARIAKRNATEISASSLNNNQIENCTYILGRNYDNVRTARSNRSDRLDVSVARWSGRQYSQFHQGAGESATIDLIPLLENAPNYSLILIDEVEASLHPRSQRRLIHHLLHLARIKQIQVILTTHSPYVLEELPHEGRILLNHGTAGIDIIYGITANYALHRMDDLNSPDLYLFMEDTEALELIREIMRQSATNLSRIECIEVGPGNVVQALGLLSESSRIPFSSLGILDADMANSPGCIKLPGVEAPEKEVFKSIINNAVAQFSARLDKGESEVRDALMQATTNLDHHKWLEDLEHLIGFSKMYLWQTMSQVYVKECLSSEEKTIILNPIDTKLSSLERNTS